MNLIGHNNILSRLENMVENNRVPSTLLFWGPEGIGKKLAAKRFAQLLNCSSSDDSQASMFTSEPASSEKPCGNCVSCRKILAGTHSDVYCVEPENKILKIDMFREIRNNAYITPFEGRFRVIIINDAHLMNTNAANSILKLLEEPQKHNIFILVTHDRSALLSTIVSRCFPIRFAPPSLEELDQIIESTGLEKNHMLSSRSPGMIAAASDQSANETIAELVDNCSTLLQTTSGVDTVSASRIHDILADSSTNLESALDSVTLLLRDIVMAMNDCNDEDIYNLERVKNLLNSGRIPHWTILLNTAIKLLDLKKQLVFNINRRLMVTNVVTTLQEAING